MSNKVMIIGKDGCSFCVNAINLSKARKIEHKYLNVPNDLSLIEAFKMAGTEFSTFPAVFIVDENDKLVEFIGGFTEYRTKASNLKL